MNCPKCGAIGRYTNHGPSVGAGWFCPYCKDDIPSPDNTFGLLAQSKLQQPTQVLQRDLNCIKYGCNVCKGSAFARPIVETKKK